MTDDEILLQLFRKDIAALIKVRPVILRMREQQHMLAEALGQPKPLPRSLTQLLLPVWGLGGFVPRLDEED